MRQRLGIFIGLILLVLVLIGLNAASYVQQEKTPDSEMRPNRSSYNAGATGTQAFYTLLAETGRNVTRWREPFDALRSRRDKPAVFVVIGDLRRPFDEIEVQSLLGWVNEGGRLVLIDRTPEKEILARLDDWKVVAKTNDLELLIGIDPYDTKQMTTEMPAARPAQPSIFTSGLNAVQTSRFASHIEFSRNPSEVDADTADEPADHTAVVDAPVVHLTGSGRNILVDARYGAGSIAILSDPYVVSNVGIGLVDNAQLATNLVRTSGGAIAFDEYHQGYGTNENRFFQYFAGTPVISIFLQLAAIAGFVLYSQSRRFARPVPEPEPDRRTKLEYVAAMAELQQRTKAYDLALENIYSDFRRRVCRMLGVDNTLANRRQLANLIGERIKGNPGEIEELMLACEDIIHGEPVNGRDALDIAAALRELERELGLVRNGKSKVVK